MTGGMPLTLGWSPVPKPGRVLFVVFGYHGTDHDDVKRGMLERWETPSARGHRIVHRDHYANPRPLSYLAAMVGSAVGALTTAAPDLVIDRRFPDAAPVGFEPLFGVIESAEVADEAAWASGLLARLKDYDHVVLVYSDALGLGCEAGERRALDSHASVLVINGRRRAFRIDSSWSGRLRLHRFLAHTRIVERLLAVVIRPLALGLARRDRARSRSHMDQQDVPPPTPSLGNEQSNTVTRA